jgi:virginiamycin B lyase
MVTRFTDPGITDPVGITAGPDGALWFVNQGAKTIGRITTSGVVTTFSDPGISSPVAITAGPDGALWFVNYLTPSGHGSVGRITTSGAVTEFSDPSIVFPTDITAGPDGALWFTNGRITTSGTVTPEPIGNHVTAGPDGALWSTFTNSSKVVRTTTSGATTTFTLPLPPGGQGIVRGEDITSGSDGNLWVTTGKATLVRLTPTGHMSQFNVPGAVQPLATGDDNALWFPSYTVSGGTVTAVSIARSTVRGGLQVFPTQLTTGVRDIASGPDGALWLTDFGDAQHPNGRAIVRVSTARSVTPSPRQGQAGAAVSVTGRGFASGEMVAVTFKSGSAQLPLCTGSANGSGTFSCVGNVPASSLGSHRIMATGQTSGHKAKSIFLVHS